MPTDAYHAFNARRIAHWDQVALRQDRTGGWGGGYHRRLNEVYRQVVAPGQRVLEIGCGRGDLLAELQPAQHGGVGVDFSPLMIERARQRHPHLRFAVQAAAELDLGETFDVVILSDLINDVWDVQAVLERARAHLHPRGRLIVNFFSHLWELPLRAARAMGLANPMLDQNWLTPPDVKSLLTLADLEPMRHWTEVLWPVRTPGLDALCNRWLVRCWPCSSLALTNLIVARPAASASTARAEGPEQAQASPLPLVSVVVPARNEAGNIESILRRMPKLGGDLRNPQIIFVEGNSSDDTWGAIQRAVAAHPELDCTLIKQPGKGKGDAVRAGFAVAKGDILTILDADLTVPPEDLPKFVQALVRGKGDFINGVRLVYPMEQEAMRFANLVGNKFFSLAFSWLLSQPIKDTLCGTKLLWKSDYQRIAANRAYFGDFDPFGDFDLLFGAARLNLKIVDLPVRYAQRTYGTTNINRWRHGLLLLRMTAFAARKLKFV